MAATGSDLLAAEVHRKALENVATEMAISLVRTSGSPVVVESKDYSTCLLDQTPEHIGFTSQAPAHLGSSLVGTQAIVEVAREQDIQPGVGWMVNDPHAGGALHQGDVAVIMPLFADDEHLGWSFVNTHILDVGGAGISGFAPGATDVFQEGLRFPAIPIIRDGAIEPAWARFIAANVRAPGPVLNDLRSMIAANNTAARKLAELVDEYGVAAHRELCEVTKQLSENLLRERIAAIPDGVYEAAEWNELSRSAEEDQLLGLRLVLTIEGSDLHFAFSGAPQVDSFINGTRGAMVGMVAGEIMRVLGYGDLPINGGIWRPLHIDLGEPGTIVNSVPPAPVSNSHGAIGARGAQLVRGALTEAMSLSDDPTLRGRVAGRTVDAFPGAAFFGTNQHGRPAVMFYVDNSTGLGGPGQTLHDGLDGTFGYGQQVGGGLSDVETHEAMDPLLFLWRRIVLDSGGPGDARGGLGLEQAYTVASTDAVAGPVWHNMVEVPSPGAGGGTPAPPGEFQILRDTNVPALLQEGTLPTRAAVRGVRDDLPSFVSQVALGRGDVWIATSGGGSGLGDPLLREPELVARDVADGYVSARQAHDVYGVALDADGAVAADATTQRRAAIRRERIGGEPRSALRAPASRGVAVLRDSDAWTCASCGHALAAGDDDWRAGDVATRETAAAERFADWQMRLRGRRQAPMVMLREIACPACAALLTIDVATDDMGPLPSARTRAQTADG
jgi:N-methylhydantoinase B